MPNWDEMTPKDVREYCNTLAHRASEWGEIKATLIVNCQEGRRLHRLGLRYDDTKRPLWNMVNILEQLAIALEKAKGDSDAD